MLFIFVFEPAIEYKVWLFATWLYFSLFLSLLWLLEMRQSFIWKKVCCRGFSPISAENRIKTNLCFYFRVLIQSFCSKYLAFAILLIVIVIFPVKTSPVKTATPVKRGRATRGAPKVATPKSVTPKPASPKTAEVVVETPVVEVAETPVKKTGEHIYTSIHRLYGKLVQILISWHIYASPVKVKKYSA